MPWPAICVIVLCGIVVAMQAGKAAIAAPMLQADLQLGLAAIGWLTGIFAVLGLLGGLPAGVWAGRIGPRTLLRLGLLMSLTGGVSGAIAQGYAPLLLSRAVEGAGFLLVTVAAPSLLESLTPPGRRDLVLALWSCFMPVGMAIIMIAGPALDHWRTLWWACAAATAVMACLTFVLVPDAGARSRQAWRELAADALAVLTARRPLLLAALFALYSLLFFALFSFLPVLLMERMQVTHQVAGSLSALAIAANILGNLAAGVLLSRGLPRALLLACASLCMGAFGCAIFLAWLPDIPTYVLCVAYSAAGGLIPATLLSTAPLAARRSAQVPVVLGLVMQGNNLGQVAGPIAVGSAITQWGWAAGAVIVLIAAATAGVLAVVGGMPEHTAR